MPASRFTTRFASSLLMAGALIFGTTTAQDAQAASKRDKAFFQKVEGAWQGPGEIVAGKYKGTKFTCTFQGSMPNAKIGMTLDGKCRVGVFTQEMKATVVSAGKSYSGSFLDGAKGEGLDIVAGNVTKDRAVMRLQRKQDRKSVV